MQKSYYCRSKLGRLAPCSSPFLPNIKSIVDLQVALVVIIKKLQKKKI